jgi:uncharacterized coiled-coil protein SlyX
VATTFADLEARVRGLESRVLRTEDDVTAIVTTVVETRDDVKWLKRAVQALLDHQGLSIAEPEDDD